MITIHKNEEEKKVWVKIESPDFKEPFWFKRDCSSEVETKLLYRFLDKILDDRIEKIRRTEYESGWSDARRRKQKRDWFHSTLNDVEV